MKKWPTRPELNIISYDLNRGKGCAIKKGILRAKGKYRLFMDIDLSTPLWAFHYFKFYPRLESTDIIIGTRKSDIGQIIESQPWRRETLGEAFTLLSRLILKVKASDFTYGFKCFSEKAAHRYFFPANS